MVANEVVLSPSDVTSGTFGRIATITGLQGAIYAQPLYMSGLTTISSAGNVVFLATEQDYVYAYDAVTYTKIWDKAFLPSGESPLTSGTSTSDVSCPNIQPNIGITGTPVIDLHTTFNSNPTLYFVTMPANITTKDCMRWT